MVGATGDQPTKISGVDIDLSIVVPAYNEAERLADSLAELGELVRQRSQPTEVIVVDDGSTDGTANVARRLGGESTSVLSLGRNRGKGAAVRAGVLASRGARVLITDADLSTPLAELDKLAAALARAEVVLGSRAVAGAELVVRQPLYRQLMGKTFNAVIRALGIRGIRDTQCGFKLLDGEAARSICALLTIERFAFDVELVWLARRLGYRVCEVGVVWRNSPSSRVHPIWDSARMLRDVLLFRWRHRRLSAALAAPLPAVGDEEVS